MKHEKLLSWQRGVTKDTSRAIIRNYFFDLRLPGTHVVVLGAGHGSKCFADATHQTGRNRVRAWVWKLNLGFSSY